MSAQVDEADTAVIKPGINPEAFAKLNTEEGLLII